jgi:hypothetical protein
VTFAAVRQFGSKDIPLRYPGWTPKNCESALLENGYLADSGEQFKVEGDLDLQAPSLKVCIGDACRDYQFIQFFRSDESRIVHHQHALRVFIGSAGNIFVEKGYYERSCGEWYRNLAHTQNIVSELCQRKVE